MCLYASNRFNCVQEIYLEDVLNNKRDNFKIYLLCNAEQPQASSKYTPDKKPILIPFSLTSHVYIFRFVKYVRVNIYSDRFVELMIHSPDITAMRG